MFLAPLKEGGFPAPSAEDVRRAVNVAGKFAAGFQSIDLEGLNAFGLMSRFDTKFIFHRDKLPKILDRLRRDQVVLESEGRRVFQYHNIYYDTPGYFFYHQHHNQKLRRYKIRLRNYADTGRCYFEIKCKTNQSRTVKKRLLLPDRGLPPVLSDAAMDFARRDLTPEYGRILDRIRPSLLVGYKRLTLVNSRRQERITVDVDLFFSDGVNRLNLDRLVVAELKHAYFPFRSDLSQALKDLAVPPTTFSKYCMGIVLLNKRVKRNRFKDHVRCLEKLDRSIHSTLPLQEAPACL